MPDPIEVKGCCPLDCSDACAWVAHVEDGRVAKVTGAKNHPITRGVLCAKVKDYQDRLTAPGRVLTPLRRSGPKGSGTFTPISWDEALDQIAMRWRTIIETHGAEALMPFWYLGSMGVVQRLAPLRLFNALGASAAHGEVCGASASALLEQGHPIGVDPEETPEAELILLWGQNVLSTGHHQWHFIAEARRRRGARIVAIDPRSTRTTLRADQHLQIKPGSDTALAAAMGRILLEEGLADIELAEAWVSDLEIYRQMVQPWTPERAAVATGLPVSEIVGLAHAFANARPALIRSGIAPMQTTGGDAYVRGLSALAILGGHWRHRGGGLSILSMPALDESRAARHDLRPRPVRSLDMTRLGNVLLDRSLAPPVMGLTVWSANPATTQINALRVKQGLAREDLFTVVLEHFVTETARFADIVLPATTQLEHFDVQGSWGHHYVTANRPAIAPIGEARSSGAFVRAMSQRLGLNDPALHESDEAMALSVLPEELTAEQLLDVGWRKLPTPRPSTGPRPKRLRIAVEPLSPPEPPSAGQLQLLTPKSHWFLNSTFANMARHRDSQGKPRIDVHPVDADRLGLPEGAPVIVRSASGRVRALLHRDPGLQPGVASLEGKWWGEPEDAAPELNHLTPARWSPLGQPAYNETFVNIEPADVDTLLEGVALVRA